MNEQWRPIHGFDRYEVSNLGNVRNLGGYKVNCGPNQKGVRAIPPRILRPFRVNSTGYMQVVLPDRRKHSVHRLVALAFHGESKRGEVVNHKNAVRHDNRAENLEWVTHSENIRYAYREMGVVSKNNGRIGAAANKTTAVVATNIGTGEVLEFACASDAVRARGFDSGQISRCCNGKAAHHKGWAFRFADGVRGFPHRANLEQDRC
jgi:hypothetical protein